MIESLVVAILLILLLVIVLWAIETLLPIDVQLKRILFAVLAILIIVWAILILTGHASFHITG